MKTGCINSIETMGLVDGPGIRTVIFLNGCKLRCKYCHNPETWNINEMNYTEEELVAKIRRYKPYYGKNGGVTFSGGEPLIQGDFLLNTMRLLKKENINIALDTSGVGNGNYEEILELTDLVIFDIKHVEAKEYLDITGQSIDESLKFIEVCNKLNKRMWIRQVIIPTVTDNIDYLVKLKDFLRLIKNIERVNFLPYHRYGLTKYEQLGIENLYKDLPSMDKEVSESLYKEFLKME